MDTLTRDRISVARGLLRDIEVAERNVTHLRAQRDRLIRELYLDGMAVRAIAAALDGMSRSHVGELVRGVERVSA